jgi:hypothetical protein
MQIPSGEGEEMVNSLLFTQGNCNSPSHGLEVVVKKIIPTTRGSASHGWNLFSCCFIALPMAPERVSFGSQKPFFHVKFLFLYGS